VAYLLVLRRVKDCLGFSLDGPARVGSAIFDRLVAADNDC